MIKCQIRGSNANQGNGSHIPSEKSSIDSSSFDDTSLSSTSLGNDETIDYSDIITEASPLETKLYTDKNLISDKSSKTTLAKKTDLIKSKD